MTPLETALISFVGSLIITLLTIGGSAFFNRHKVRAETQDLVSESYERLRGALEDRIAALEKQNGEQAIKITTLEGERENSKKASAQRDLEIAHLQAQLAIVSESLIVVTQQRDDLQGRVRALEAEVAALRAAQAGQLLTP